jgi:CMP-N,N'-diacetyllegionaminic acid synthase
MTVVGLIPARAGSRRLPNKNLACLAGKPLLSYTCLAARQSGVLTALYVNTDSPAIAEVAQRFGAECPVLRPAELARDDSPTLAANRFLLEFLAARGQTFDAVMVLQPTSPLRTAEDIRAAWELFVANAPCAVVSASPIAPAYWVGRIGRDGRFEPLSGEDILYGLNGAIYIHTCADYIKGNSAPRTLVYPMPRSRGVDIDTWEDLQYAEFLLRQSIRADGPTGSGVDC